MNIDTLIRNYTRASYALTAVWLAWAGASWVAYLIADLNEQPLWWGGYWW